MGRKLSKTLHPSQDSVFFNDRKADYIVGLDEVGRGCLAGPVVAACFYIDCSQDWESFVIPENVAVYDSKMLSEKVREDTQSWLMTQNGVGAFCAEASVEEIDEINILRASHLAMARAMEKFFTQIKVSEGEKQIGILVDGHILPPGLHPDGINFQSQALTKGDRKSFTIAAASILAKSYRDRLMRKYSEEYSGYGWESNVGYPTQEHKDAIQRLGSTPLHRRSFRGTQVLSDSPAFQQFDA